MFQYDLPGHRTLEAVLLDPAAALEYNPVDYVDQLTRYSYYYANGLPELKRTILQKINGNPSDHVTLTTYDDLGRVDTVTDPSPSDVYVHKTYDDKGRLHQKIINDGHKTTTTTFEYDGHDRVVSEDVASGDTHQKTYYGYDALNRRVYIRDPKGHESTTAYNDLVGTTVTVTTSGEGLSRNATYTHDVHGNEIEQNVPSMESDNTTSLPGQTTKRRYDSLGRLTSTVYPDSSDTPGETCTNCEQREYDPASRLKTVKHPLRAYLSRQLFADTSCGTRIVPQGVHG